MNIPLKRLEHSIGEMNSQTIDASIHPYPDWRRMISDDWEEWQAALLKAGGGPRILIATGVGGYAHVSILDSLLAAALTLRGADIHILLCDGALPACEYLTIHDTLPEPFAKNGVQKERCLTCFQNADRMYREMGLPVHYYSEFLTLDDVQNSQKIAKEISFHQIPDYQLEDIRSGAHALAGALRFFARGTIDGEEFAEPVLRHYFRASLLTARAAKRFFSSYGFSSISFHHGIYIPQGVIGDVARSLGIRVINWMVAYRKKSFIFSHGDTYHYTLISEPVSTWENMEWSDRHEMNIMDYVKSRQKGIHDWIWYHERPQENIDAIISEVGFKMNKPVIGMLTNVMWDAQLHYPANAFPNMLSWVIQTIRYFEKRPDLQLVIRIHPAELRGTVQSRQLMMDEIRKLFPRIPENVFVIPPESQISTYAMTSLCNAVIIYGTKTGVELTSFGIPVIVAGEAWIRNKGLTLDALSVSTYVQLLDQLPLTKALDHETTCRARKYAYHFFFRRMIPIQSIESVSGWPPYGLVLKGLKQLEWGADQGLDTICNGILSGSDFIYPAECLKK